MGISKTRVQIPEFIKKFRYAIIVLFIGVAFMLLPSGEDNNDSISVAESIAPQQIESVEQRLEQLLSAVSGAGKVKVLLTTEVGEQTIYQSNQDGSESGRKTTVTVTDSQRNETGLIQQIISASYRGAIVVCEGADDSTIRLAIVDAVSDATGLRSDRISVLKMK